MRLTKLLIGPSTLFFQGRPIGYTEGGITLSPEDTIKRYDNVDQVDGVADIVHYNTKLVMKFTMLDFTLNNLAMAWGLNTALSQSQGAGYTMLTGNWDLELPEGEFKVYSALSSGAKVIVTVPIAKVIPGGEAAWSKTGEAKIPCTLESLSDANGLQFTIEVENIPL